MIAPVLVELCGSFAPDSYIRLQYGSNYLPLGLAAHLYSVGLIFSETSFARWTYRYHIVAQVAL